MRGLHLAGIHETPAEESMSRWERKRWARIAPAGDERDAMEILQQEELLPNEIKDGIGYSEPRWKDLAQMLASSPS